MVGVHTISTSSHIAHWNDLLHVPEIEMYKSIYLSCYPWVDRMLLPTCLCCFMCQSPVEEIEMVTHFYYVWEKVTATYKVHLSIDSSFSKKLRLFARSTSLYRQRNRFVAFIRCK